MISGAIIEGPYRYALWRYWSAPNEPMRPFAFIMLNPSKANEKKDDPTIRRCMGYVRAWGGNGLIVVNLFAWRSTDPEALKHVADPVGPKNLEWLDWAVRGTGSAVAAWGGKVPEKYKAYVAMVRDRYPGQLTTLKINADYTPAHPLFLKGTLTPRLWA